MSITKCGWLLASNLIAIACCAAYCVMVDGLEKRVLKLEAEAAALQGCMPQSDGDISAMARRGNTLECAISTRGKGQRQMLDRISYKTQ